MGGHKEGIIAYGNNLDDAGNKILAMLREVLQEPYVMGNLTNHAAIESHNGKLTLKKMRK